MINCFTKYWYFSYVLAAKKSKKATISPLYPGISSAYQTEYSDNTRKRSRSSEKRETTVSQADVAAARKRSKSATVTERTKGTPTYLVFLWF